MPEVLNVQYPAWMYASGDWVGSPLAGSAGASTAVDISGGAGAGAAAGAGSGAGAGAAAGAGSGALGGASFGIAIGNAIGSLYSAWSTGRTAKEVGRMQANIAEYNRRMAQLGAESAYRQSQADVFATTMRAGAIASKQRAGYAARGVALGVGSTAETAATNVIMKEVDKATAKENAVATAWGYKKQALSNQAQGEIARISGSYAGAKAFGDAVSGTLADGMEVAEKWYKRGAFNNTPSNA